MANRSPVHRLLFGALLGVACATALGAPAIAQSKGGTVAVKTPNGYTPAANPQGPKSTLPLFGQRQFYKPHSSMGPQGQAPNTHPAHMKGYGQRPMTLLSPLLKSHTAKAAVSTAAGTTQGQGGKTAATSPHCVERKVVYNHKVQYVHVKPGCHAGHHK